MEKNDSGFWRKYVVARYLHISKLTATYSERALSRNQVPVIIGKTASHTDNCYVAAIYIYIIIIIIIIIKF